MYHCSDPDDRDRSWVDLTGYAVAAGVIILGGNSGGPFAVAVGRQAPQPLMSANLIQAETTPKVVENLDQAADGCNILFDRCFALSRGRNTSGPAF